MATNFLYRFRSVDSLLNGHEELKKQEIYFASSQQLNDPTEGSKEIFWMGDRIVWKNFLSHYLLCLQHIFTIVRIHPNDSKLEEIDIPIYTSVDVFSGLGYEKFKKCLALFFENSTLNKYLDYFSTPGRIVQADELLFFFRSIHNHALNCIILIYEDCQLYFTQQLDQSMKVLDDIIKLERDNPGCENIKKIIYSLCENLIQETNLIDRYNSTDSSYLFKKKLILLEFPNKYIKSLEKLMHFQWYASCFLSSYENPSMWAYYGDEHKGVCLKFKTLPNEQNVNQIKLNGIIGTSSSGPVYGDRSFLFYEVKYLPRRPEINFFQSLGLLSNLNLRNYWYMDEDNNVSSCADNIFNDYENWHKKYWDDFCNIVTTKVESWMHEKEYRLVLFDLISIRQESKARKFRYDFADLEGLIFGERTSEDNKIEIIKILEEKCKAENRIKFDLYQARHCKVTGKIKAIPCGVSFS